MRYSRQNKILELINKYEIETQDKLASLLNEEGFKVTQATISRDIKEMQLIKVLSSTGNYKYAVSQRQDAPITDRFVKIYQDTVISIASATNMILIKTLSGCGSAAAEAVDNIGLPNIVGSIAGDNTALVIVNNEENVPELLDKLNNLIVVKKQDKQ